MIDNTLDKRTLYVFNKRGGKVVRIVEGTGRGMIGFWALRNTTKGRASVLTLDDHQIERVYVGRDGGCPEVKHIDKTDFVLNMDDYIKDEQHLNLNSLLIDLEKLGL